MLNKVKYLLLVIGLLFLIPACATEPTQQELAAAKLAEQAVAEANAATRTARLKKEEEARVAAAYAASPEGIAAAKLAEQAAAAAYAVSSEGIAAAELAEQAEAAAELAEQEAAAAKLAEQEAAAILAAYVASPEGIAAAKLAEQAEVAAKEADELAAAAIVAANAATRTARLNKEEAPAAAEKEDPSFRLQVHPLEKVVSEWKSTKASTRSNKYTRETLFIKGQVDSIDNYPLRLGGGDDVPTVRLVWNDADSNSYYLYCQNKIIDELKSENIEVGDTVTVNGYIWGWNLLINSLPVEPCSIVE